MQERFDLTPADVNRDLLRFPLHTPLWFWFAIMVLRAVLRAGVIAFTSVVIVALQPLGYNNRSA